MRVFGSLHTEDDYVPVLGGVAGSSPDVDLTAVDSSVPSLQAVHLEDVRVLIPRPHPAHLQNTRTIQKTFTVPPRFHRDAHVMQNGTII